MCTAPGDGRRPQTVCGPGLCPVSYTHLEELDEDFLCGLLEVRQSMFRLLRRTDMSEEARAGAALALAHDGESRLRRREFAGLREVCGRYETASGELLEKKLAPSREMGFQRRQLEEEYLDQLERLEEI